MMSISTRAMQLFVAVLDTGNFSGVARRESISPSSVSRIISQLEDELGLQLLFRNTRTVVPTEAGRLYGNTFRRVLDELSSTTLQLQERESQPSGLVRINAPVVFGYRHIAPWLAELTERYPGLRIELTQTDDFIDPLSDTADLLFRIAPLQDSGLHVRVVDTSVYHLAASPEYLARHGTPQAPDELMDHRCLVYKGIMGAQKLFFTKPGQATEMQAPQGVLLSNNAETLLNAALQGGGVIAMPDWLIGGLLKQRQLVRLLPDYQVAISQQELVIAMLYPHARFMPLNVRTVIDFFADKFGSPAYWKYQPAEQ